MFQITTKPEPVKKSAGLVFFLFLFPIFSSESFAADKTPPIKASIKINNNSYYTSSNNVTLTLSASDSGSGMKKGKMRFSNDHSNWSSAESYKTTKSWSLSPGNGAKTVYAKFSDSSGNWMSQAVSDNINVDTVKPSKPRVTDSGASTSSTSSLYASWSASYSISGISEYQYQITQDSSAGTVKVSWTSAGTSTSVTKTGLSLTSGKSYYFGVKAKNGVGFWSDVGYSDGITVNSGSDTTPPTGSIKINSGASYCSSTGVTLTLSASDSGSGMGKMKFSNDNSIWSSEESYSASKSWSLSSGGTTKTVYAKFSDASGNWITLAVSDSITLDTIKSSKPTVTDSGSSTSSTTSLYASWSSSDTTSGIAEYQYQITRDSSSGTTIVSWTSAGTSTSTTKTGLSLTIGKSYYFVVKAKNGAGLWSDTGYSDGITVTSGSDTSPPVISSFSPDPNSFIYKGKTQTLSLTTSDSGDSSNEYQFSVDAAVKQSWSTKTSYSWDTSGLDTKSYILKFEAKDQGGSSSKTAKAFVLNEPVEPPEDY
ncbi:MAG: hypothetical protein AABZ65_03320 [Candidatus Omnitrophota bacterium]